MKSDPLAGLTGRRRKAYEDDCRRYLAHYDPTQHNGWFAEATRAPVRRYIVGQRLDLDHPALPGHTLIVDCVDCGANLQLTPDIDGLPTFCLCCAAERARGDG